MKAPTLAPKLPFGFVYNSLELRRPRFHGQVAQDTGECSPIVVVQ